MKIGCLAMLVGLLIVALIGGACFSYTLDFWFGKDIPWYGDAICGSILSEIVVPVALVTIILDWCGVDHPVFCKPPAQTTTRPS